MGEFIERLSEKDLTTSVAASHQGDLQMLNYRLIYADSTMRGAWRTMTFGNLSAGKTSQGL